MRTVKIMSIHNAEKNSEVVVLHIFPVNKER